MGYSTRYEWKMEPEVEAAREFIKQRKDDFYGIDADGDYAGECKWYDHEGFMRELSRAFPEVLFTLDGAGETSGDIWRKYFKGGKCQKAKAVITLAEFDPGMLK